MNPQLKVSSCSVTLAMVCLFGSTCHEAAGTNLSALRNEPSLTRATKSLQIVGSQLFIAGWGYGVQVLNISDPANPKWQGSWNPRRCPMGIQVVGDYAFIADRIAGLTVLNVANVSRPEWITTIDTPGDAKSLHVVKDRAYVADGAGSGLLVFDISEPRQPKLLRKYDQDLCPYTVQVVEETAYINSAGPIKFLNIASSENRVSGVTLNSGGSMFSQVVGPFHFVPGVSGLLVFSSQSNMLLGRCREGAGSSIFVLGEHAFVASVRGLSVLDVKDASAARMIASVDVGAPQNDVVVAGNHAYLLDNGVNLRVFDISDVQNPRQVGFFPATRYSSSPISFNDVAASSVSSEGKVGTLENLNLGAVTDRPPQLEKPHRLPDGQFSFRLAGVPDRSYVIEASTDLTEWTAITTKVLPASGVVEIHDPEATAYSQRYYRAVMVEHSVITAKPPSPQAARDD